MSSSTHDADLAAPDTTSSVDLSPKRPRATTDSLPDDLLVNIFISTQAISSCNIDWVVVSQVCRRWRTVALASHALWACIFPASRESAYTCLLRACSAPIRLKWGLPEKLPSRAAVVMCTHRVVAVDMLFNTPGAGLLLLLMERDAQRDWEGRFMHSQCAFASSLHRCNLFAIDRLRAASQPAPLLAHLGEP